MRKVCWRRLETRRKASPGTTIDWLVRHSDRRVMWGVRLTATIVFVLCHAGILGMDVVGGAASGVGELAARDGIGSDGASSVAACD